MPASPQQAWLGQGSYRMSSDQRLRFGGPYCAAKVIAAWSLRGITMDGFWPGNGKLPVAISL